MVTTFPALSTDPADPDVWGQQLHDYIDERAGGATMWAFRTSSSQSFPNAWTAIGWGVEDSGASDTHSTTTNPSRWTCPADGTYLFAAGMCYDGGGSVYFQYAINGTRAPGRVAAPAGANMSTTLVRTFALEAGDYVEFMGYSSAGDGATKVLADDESVFTVVGFGGPPLATYVPDYAPDATGIYDHRLNLYNVTPENSRRSEAALARAGRADNDEAAGVFNILWIGDSIPGGCTGLEAGPGGSDRFDRTHTVAQFYAQEISNQTGVPIAGTGLMRIHDGTRWDDRFTLNSTAADANEDPGASVFLPTGATVTYETEFDDMSIFTLTYYDNFAGATGCSFSVDGATSGDGFAAPVGTGPGQWKSVTLELDAPVPAGTAVVATGIASGNTMVIGHIEARSAAGGISSHNLSASGSGAYTWADFSGGGFNLLRTVHEDPAMLPWEYDEVHIAFGLFDAENSNVADYKTNMAAIKAYFPNSSIVIHAMPVPGTYAATPDTWLDFVTAAFDLADTFDCRLVDVQGLLGGYDVESALGLTADDTAHFLQTASKMWGRAAAGLLVA